MCGVFGFAVRNAVPMVKAFGVLRKLENHQYPQEQKPVGGYGAGVAILLNNGRVVLQKVGKVSNSPVNSLSKIKGINEACVLVGHVRMPSPEFMTAAKFRETTQPYVVRNKELTLVSVHNGKVENYKELKTKLSKSHAFESEKIELIDSEVIPHVFEELLNGKRELDEALRKLLCVLQGSNTAVLLHVREKDAFLHFVHKGKTRGLTIWTNKQGEILFCSRREPMNDVFSNVLSRGEFVEEVSIGWHENVEFRLSHLLDFKVKR